MMERLGAAAFLSLVLVGCGSTPSPTPSETLSVSLSANPTTGETPLTVTLTATASPTPDKLSYFWSFGDGESSQDGQTVTHVYRNPGSYRATVTVRDEGGRTAIAEQLIEVTSPGDVPPPPDDDPPATDDNEAPSVTLLADPAIGQAPLTVGLAADAFDQDGDELTYEWRLDGEVIGANASGSITLPEPGVYTVSVTVDDGHGGSAEDSALIEVEESESKTLVLGEDSGEPLVIHVGTPDLKP